MNAVIPIIEEAQEILDRYASNCIDDHLLPVPSNSKMNAYLKEVAVICNIEKEFTTHIGRHTFATTITLNRGISMEVLQSMMGMTSTKHLQIYAKMHKETVHKEMMGLGRVIGFASKSY